MRQLSKAFFRWPKRIIMRAAPSHVPIAVKLSLAIIILLVLGMATLGLFIANSQNQLMREQLHDFGTAMVLQLAQMVAEPILSEDTLGLHLLATNLEQGEKILGIGVYSHEGHKLSSAGLQPAQDLDLFKFDDAKGVRFEQWYWINAAGVSERLISFIAPITYQEISVGSAVVTLSASLMDQAAAKARYAIIYSILIVSMLGALVAYWLSRRLSTPIHDLMEATKAIDRGDLAVRIHDRRNDEIGFLMEGFNNMAAGLLKKNQVEQVFSRYVSKNVADKVLENLDEIRLGGRHVEATVIFADIVGFTAMSEHLQPHEVSELLNEYFSYISTACVLYNGMVDKFIGDCAMLVFGATDDDSDHTLNAICCAVLIQKLAETLNQRRRQNGQMEVNFRIGVNSGTMLAGNLGSDERMEYTVVGDAVNLASRLCYVAQPGQIVIREELANAPQNIKGIEAYAEQTIAIRGKSQPVAIYSVRDVHPKYHAVMHANLERVLNYRSANSRRQVENA